MLYYLLFWTLLGFIIHFYIIFGTNLLTGGPAQNCCFFCLFQSFAEKEYQKSKRNENLRERDFWNEHDPGDLDPKSRKLPGSHEVGGAPTPLGAPSTLVGPSLLHRPTSSSYIYPYTPQTSGSTTKPYFHRRNLLYPRDPILGPPELRRRGNQSPRASTSTP